MSQAFVVDGSRSFDLDEVDPSGGESRSDEQAERRLEKLVPELLDLQALVQAAEKHAVLIILQGMDAAGKDLTIQQALGTANPEAIRVKHFSEMTEDEALHDFLWRAHNVTPARGEWVVFDRSYYEQVVEPIVDGETNEQETAERCRDIRDFERILHNAGTIVIKLFLHVSRDEQERRLVERMEQDETAWKISASDWEDHRRWDDFMKAWAATISATATPDAPWLIVPADRDAIRNLAAAEAVVERLRSYREEWAAERTRIGSEKRQEALKEAPEHVRAGV
ncbi:MAG TPA: PPK2 family polyphosphate kinase [Candidatus Limnocylindrales bacterium]|nr:PPK2 family polyphosphate kinase [Candidatus Limnocylindrales bacterium]